MYCTGKCLSQPSRCCAQISPPCRWAEVSSSHVLGITTIFTTTPKPGRRLFLTLKHPNLIVSTDCLSSQVYVRFTFSTSATFMRTRWWMQVSARSSIKVSTHVSMLARLNTTFSCFIYSCCSEISCSCCSAAVKVRFRNDLQTMRRLCIYPWWESGVMAQQLGQRSEERVNANHTRATQAGTFQESGTTSRSEELLRAGR